MTESPNVFVLSADSLSHTRFREQAADIASAVGGTRFTNAIATASDTNSAMPGLAAGVYSDSVSGWGLPDTNAPTTIAQALETAGYTSAMWTDNFLFGEQYNYDVGFSGGDLGKPTRKKRVARAVKSSPLAPAFGIAEWLYFNAFSPIVELATGEQSFYQPAEELHRNCLEWLATQNGPVFCWLHYMDTHHPYEPPVEYLDGAAAPYSRSEIGELSRKVIKSDGERTSAEELAAVASAYDGACDHLSTEVLEFLAVLKREGHFDPERDILVFTADHGECLNPERRMLGHVPPAFWEEIINVPLVIATPDWEPQVVTEQVSLIQLFPTLLKQLNIDVPTSADGFGGGTPSDMSTENALFVSEWGTDEGGLDETYRGIRTEEGKKLFGAHLDGEDVYVATEFDGESESVVHIGSEPPSGPPWDELRDRLSERGAAIESNDSVADGRDVHSHLKDLGYVD